MDCDMCGYALVRATQRMRWMARCVLAGSLSTRKLLACHTRQHLFWKSEEVKWVHRNGCVFAHCGNENALLPPTRSTFVQCTEEAAHTPHWLGHCTAAQRGNNLWVERIVGNYLAPHRNMINVDFYYYVPCVFGRATLFVSEGDLFASQRLRSPENRSPAPTWPFPASYGIRLSGPFSVLKVYFFYASEEKQHAIWKEMKREPLEWPMSSKTVNTLRVTPAEEEGTNTRLRTQPRLNPFFKTTRELRARMRRLLGDI